MSVMREAIRDVLEAHGEVYDNHHGEHLGCTCGADPVISPVTHYWGHVEAGSAWYREHLLDQLDRALE
jgi:hypothetical protein